MLVNTFDTRTSRYAVATQDPGLKKVLREVPGVPIINLLHGTVVIDAISAATTEWIETRGSNLISLSDADTRLLSKVLACFPP